MLYASIIICSLYSSLYTTTTKGVICRCSRIKKFNYYMLNLVVFISLRQGKLGDFLVAVLGI
jgi:hypothetical protein